MSSLVSGNNKTLGILSVPITRWKNVFGKMWNWTQAKFRETRLWKGNLYSFAFPCREIGEQFTTTQKLRSAEKVKLIILIFWLAAIIQLAKFVRVDFDFQLAILARLMGLMPESFSSRNFKQPGLNELGKNDVSSKSSFPTLDSFFADHNLRFSSLARAVLKNWKCKSQSNFGWICHFLCPSL